MWLIGAQQGDSYCQSGRILCLFGLSIAFRNMDNCGKNGRSFGETGQRSEQKLFSSPTPVTKGKPVEAIA